MAGRATDCLQRTLDLLVLKSLATRGRMPGDATTLHIQTVSKDTLRVEDGSLYPARNSAEATLHPIARDVRDRRHWWTTWRSGAPGSPGLCHTASHRRSRACTRWRRVLKCE